ncbi:CD74 molecule, major histocompatibility complex, class II invariant chain b [Colossoma macropomum]|uniref:CD74 molecule, major histocompatibility complex, class II invariant chain b n=1 Tax=Colossoma macropomum TaxID=42526 RepID=UPI0018650C56|nr:CD74 molecule, major histocompatibility complex, class II invariant chain b [Colossoma macropomum]
MSDPQDGPLLRTPSVTTSTGSSNKQALKVTALTLLATLLIAGQAFTAYMLFNQKERLSTLESHSTRLEELGRRATAMRSPMKMALPMNSLPLLMDDAVTEKKAPSTPAPKKELTQCQQEATGLVDVRMHSYKPTCDENGDYEPQQCWDAANKCWCVDKSGAMLENSMADGPADCGKAKVGALE